VGLVKKPLDHVGAMSAVGKQPRSGAGASPLAVEPAPARRTGRSEEDARSAVQLTSGLIVPRDSTAEGASLWTGDSVVVKAKEAPSEPLRLWEMAVASGNLT
jgi:hypothetical protein